MMEANNLDKRCINHPGSQGVAFCKRCNGYICRECIIVVEGKGYCKKCYNDAQKDRNNVRICINHHDKLGIVLCKKCGGYLCTDCVLVIDGKKYCRKCYNNYQDKVQNPIIQEEPEIRYKSEANYSESNQKILENNINKKTTRLRISVIVIASFILLASILSMYLWRYHERRHLRAAEDLENIQDYRGAIQQTKIYIMNHPDELKANIKLLKYFSQLDEFDNSINILKKVDSLAESKNKSSKYEVLSAASLMLKYQLNTLAKLRQESIEKNSYSKYITEINLALPRIFYLDSLSIKYKGITSVTSTKKDALCITTIDTVMTYLKNELLRAEVSNLWKQASTLYNQRSFRSAAFKFEQYVAYLTTNGCADHPSIPEALFYAAGAYYDAGNYVDASDLVRKIRKNYSAYYRNNFKKIMYVVDHIFKSCYDCIAPFEWNGNEKFRPLWEDYYNYVSNKYK